jgi:thiol:disulfide interchange protein DsbD
VLTGFEVNAPAASFALPEGEVSGPPVISAAEFSVLTAVLYAFIGGLLLNLMPCVFPVLSLKALAVVKSAGNTARQKRMEGFAYTAGVILSFLVVASVLLVFRAGGEAVGWGFQLQSTWFIGTLAVLLFAVGLNLSGYFEFGGRFIGIGQDLADRGGNAGAFFTGVLATIVATPCTAPFMATALGYALVQPAVVALSVFAALGLGLAFPFLLISAIPAFGKILPKPGPWMERFKQFLAFPMYGTVIWLIWVLGQQAGMNAVAAALAALMLVPFAIWAWRLGSGTRLVGRGLAFISMAGLVWLLAFANAQDSVAVHGAGETAADFEVYDPGVLAAYRAENMTVFVNFTAAWCITCLANEQVALSTDEVRDHFEDNGIRYLKADWTKRDPTITAALAEFGRNGVPLYVYYPAQGEPVVLPQLLTSGIVLDELKAADRQAVAAAAPN